MIRFRKILLACAENILAIEQEVWQAVILVTVKCLLVLLITVRSHGLLLLLIYYVGEAKRILLGSYIESKMGRINYLSVYMLSGIFGSVISLLWDLYVTGEYSISVGASGAVYGIMGAFLIFTLPYIAIEFSEIKGKLIQLKKIKPEKI